MKHLSLAVIGAPLTLWTFYTSYFTIISHDASLSHRILALILSLLALKINISLIASHLQSRRALALGYGTAPTLPLLDPLLGLDAFISAVRAAKAFQLMPYYASRFRRYGHTHYTIALGRPILMTSNRDNIKTILSTKIDDWPIDGPRLWAVLPLLGPKSIFSSNGEQWHQARAMIRPSFVRDQVADLRVFERHIQNFIAAIPAEGETFDIQDLLLKMTMDSSSDFMLGYSTNSLVKAEEEAARFLEDFEYASYEATKRARFGPILFSMPHPKLKAATGRLREYIRGELHRAVEMDTENEREEKEGSYVFLTELRKTGADEEHMIDQILSIIIAGRDTTAVAASSVLYCLARRPDSVRKLREEIAGLGVESPSWDELRGMRYLNNVVREALRLFPPIATNSRTSNKETVLPHGGGADGSQPVLVPAGTSVRWSLYSLHRNKDVYGPDAEEFRPERFDELRLGWDYIPFHGGPRICIGQQFALTQVAYLLYKFFSVFSDIEAREEDGPFMKPSITFSFAHGCLVAVRK